MFKFNVRLNGKLIDSVFYQVAKSETIAEAVESVKKSLINNDGYSSGIVVTWPKGQRLTSDYWELQGDYGQGWECLTASPSFKECRADKKSYLENAPCPLRIVRKRERK